MSSRWIFLRGLMRESRHWGKFPELFRQAMPDAEMMLPDLPGNGYLHGCHSPIRVAGMVEHCRATMLAQGFAPPYHLLALSLGGMVATEWAHRYPDELRVCVLMNTSMRPFSPFHQRLRWHNYPAVLRLATMRRDPLTIEQTVLRLTSNRPDMQEKTLPTWARYRQECPVAHRNALRQLFAAATFRAPAQKPRVPMLVLVSGNDKLVDPACSLRLVQEWKADLAIHPDAGHDLPLDDGNWVAKQVCDWVGSLSSHQYADAGAHDNRDIARE